MTTDAKDSSPKLEAKDILNYLRLEPNFFRHNPEILSGLNLPHESGAAKSSYAAANEPASECGKRK